MSDTDIYKRREIPQATSNESNSKKGDRRHRASSQPFDDKNRTRRSSNSGIRRLLHLSRKSKNEKKFWWGLLISIVLILAVVALWQFWYLVKIEQAQTNEKVQKGYPSQTPSQAQ